MVDVLRAAGNLWQTLVRTATLAAPFNVRIVSPRARPFRCGNAVPVIPDVSIRENPAYAHIVVLPELWLGPDEHLGNRYPACWHGSAPVIVLDPACTPPAPAR